MLRMTAAVWRANPDCFFSPSVYTYFPLPPGLPALVTIHDAIAERFPQLTVPSRRARLFWNLKVKLAIAQSRRVLTVSAYAARDIARVHRIPAENISVALEAPSPAYASFAASSQSAGSVQDVARRAGIPTDARWFTYVGGFNPHKNVPVIIRAHAALARELGRNTPHLALVGTLDRDVFHGDQSVIRSAILDAQTETIVHWTGFLSDADLALLHSDAIALLIPSECEGFGLPAVEAASCGTPVIGTTESPLPQLLEGGGIWVSPGSEQELLDAMRALANDRKLRSTLGRTAQIRARALSWDDGARSCLAALRSVVSGTGST